MKKLLSIALAVLMFSGCDGLGLTSVEDEYKQARTNGELAKQIQLVDKLYQQSPEQHQVTLEEKEYLLPYLQQLMDDPRSYKSINDGDLERILAFSPNYEPFSLAKRYFDERKQLLDKITESEIQAKTAKETITEKLSQTPKHIETYDSKLSLKGIEPYFIASKYGKKLTESLSDKSLNGYQLASVVKGITDVFVANESKLAALTSLDNKAVASLSANEKEFIKENGDIQRILLSLYKKQLVVSYSNAVESNEYLQSLLNSTYGRERLDDVWLRLVEPAAKKAVMNAKQTYLASLDLIAAKIHKTATNVPRLKKVYSQSQNVEELLLALMWPPNGLENFKESSKESERELKRQIARLKQI